MTPRPSRQDGSGGFDEYKLLILDALERLEVAIKELDAKLDTACDDITALKVKAGFWGALGGLVAGAVIGALVSKVLH